MGLDLTVGIPLYPGSNIVYNRLMFDRMDFDQFRGLGQPLPVGQVLRWYMDEGLGPVIDDAYGERLTLISPSDLHIIIVDGFNHWNTVMMKFLIDLPGETILVLYWH